MDRFIRTEALIGKEGIEKLKKSKIVVFGLGGVGGHVLETLVRCAVEDMILIDPDTINETNLNRQIITTESNLGRYKTDEAKKRALSINSDSKIVCYKKMIGSGKDLEFLDQYKIDYIIDAIDGFEGKISLIKYASKRGIPVISSMGTGNKLDPSKLMISDIYKTEVCPLAKKVRQRLRKENIKSLKVVFSPEEPIKHNNRYIGSISFVPSAAGILMASEVIKDILAIFERGKYNGK